MNIIKTDKYGMPLKFGDSVIIDNPDIHGRPKVYGPQSGDVYRVASAFNASPENSGVPADVFAGCVYLDGDWIIDCKRVIKIQHVFCGEIKHSYEMHSGRGLEI